MDIEADKKHLVNFSQEGCVYVADDQSLLHAALEANVPLYHVCGGNAKCSTCRVVVVEGAQWLTPPNGSENALKHKMHFPPNVRLACQTFLTGGPVKVSRILKDETDIGLYVGSVAGDATQEMGEECELVLFFLDVRNFTPFIGKNLAFDVMHLIRKLFMLIENIIREKGGRIIEIAGDGIYAAFGFNRAKTEAVDAAVAASLLILEDLQQLNKTYFKPNFNYEVEIGIGLHVGNVITGNIRLGNEDHFVVMGYPVNIASRLQSLTKELDNNIIISDQLYKELANPPANHSSTFANLKGVEGVCQVHLIGNSYSQKA
jgi:adenylate cyclase